MGQVVSNFITKEQFPLVIQPEGKAFSLGEFLEWVKAEKGEIQRQLLEGGAILLRNFPVENALDFETVIRTLDFGNFISYIGGDSPRTKITEGVYTSTEAPAHFKLPLHNELSFVKNYPQHIYFYCETPPVVGGETIIADARKVYQAIDPAVRARFEEKGLKYLSCYYHKSKLMDFINSMQRSHKTWLDVFETDDKKEVETKCLENEFEFQWNQNDWIQIAQTRPADFNPSNDTGKGVV